MNNGLHLRLIKFLTAEEFGPQHNIKHPYLHEVFTHHIKSHPCEACDLLRELTLVTDLRSTNKEE